MTNTKKINNAPYYTAGALAIIFSAGAVASIAALYMGLPALIFASVGAACILLATILFSVLSVAAIRNNKTIAKQETQLTEKVKKKDDVIASMKDQLAEKDVVIAEQETQLTGKAEEIEAANKAIAEKDAQLIKQVASVSEERDELIEANRMLQEMLREEDDKFADSLFNDHNDDAKRELQKTRQDKFERLVAKRKQEEASVLSNQSPIVLAYKDAEKETQPQGDHNETAAQSRVKSTKAASKQKESNWFSTKAKALGALSVISAIASSGVLDYLFNQVSSDISPVNNSINTVNDHNNSSTLANPFNPETTLDNKLDQVEKILNLSQESAKKNFGVDPDKCDFVDDTALKESTLIHGTETVKQNILTSVSSMMKDMFFNLLISNVEDMLFNLFTSSTQVGQNDPTKDCTGQYDDQTFASNPCSNGNIPSGFVYNNGTTDYVTPPIQANGIVEQNMSTSLYSRMKDRFFSLFTSEDTTYNPESYTNGIAYEAASKKQAGAVNEVVAEDVAAVVEENTQVGQNESAFYNGRPAPLFGLQGIVLYHQSIPRSAPSSGP